MHFTMPVTATSITIIQPVDNDHEKYKGTGLTKLML